MDFSRKYLAYYNGISLTTGLIRVMKAKQNFKYVHTRDVNHELIGEEHACRMINSKIILIKH